MTTHAFKVTFSTGESLDVDNVDGPMAALVAVYTSDTTGDQPDVVKVERIN